MKILSLYKSLAFYICVAIAVAAAFAVFPYYKPNDRNSSEFSAHRVSDDIRVISKSPHSIQHPKERKVLGNFLFHRLQQMGGTTQMIEYDTIPSKIGGKFSYSNIYSVFEPVRDLFPDKVDSATSYVLLTAHYDSRYRQIVGKDTVYSYGAADDGYGVGTILELVNQARKDRGEWKQGIKVLFTDAEEHNLDGMRSAFAHNKEVFEDVNFVINVEARGVKGPALLFETSPGNEKIMQLYAHANNPSGLSLTSAVYRYLPNDTDFSVVKDSIPGINISVIDNLHYYHTDKDNFTNISLRSIQHYGDQLEPLLAEYLANEEYSGSNALKGEKDIVFFALPLLGLFAFSKTGYFILNLVFYALFAFVLFLYVKYKMIPFREILKAIVHLFVFMVAAFVATTAAVWVAADMQEIDFSFIELKYLHFDNLIALCSIFVFALLIILFTRFQEKKYKSYAWSLLLAAEIVAGLLSLVLLVAFGENFFIFIPFAFASAALFFCVAKNFKWLYLVSCSVVAFVSAHFLYLLYVALTVGALGGIMLLLVLYIALLVAQYLCIKRDIL